MSDDDLFINRNESAQDLLQLFRIDWKYEKIKVDFQRLNFNVTAAFPKPFILADVYFRRVISAREIPNGNVRDTEWKCLKIFEVAFYTNHVFCLTS